MDINYIKKKIKNEEDILLFEDTYNFVNNKLFGLYYSNGELLINHILDVVKVLIDFNADMDTIKGCLLYETVKNGVSRDEIELRYGIDVADIAYLVSRINNYDFILDDDSQKNYLEELKRESKSDVRCLFIILADRFSRLKATDKCDIQDKIKIASETMDLLVPMALKLGLNYIKSCLEDLCLFYFNPGAYKEIYNKLGATPDILKVDLNIMKQDIEELLIENDIKFVMRGRVKNLYSIYNKIMNGKSFGEIYDILAFRIIVDNEDECNRVLELIHSRYNFMPNRFKDYINNPKENMYQSLHTTIIYDNRFYEIQIRTNEMHKNAEIGSASHDLYKKKTLKHL